MTSRYQDDIPAYKPPVSTVTPSENAEEEDIRQETVAPPQAENPGLTGASPSEDTKDEEIQNLINEILKEEGQPASISDRSARNGNVNPQKVDPGNATETSSSPTDAELRQVIEKILNEGEVSSEQSTVNRGEAPEAHQREVSEPSKETAPSPNDEEIKKMIDEILEEEGASEKNIDGSADESVGERVIEESQPIGELTEREEEESLKKWLWLNENIEKRSKEYRELKGALENPRPDKDGHYSIYSKENINRFNYLMRTLGRLSREKEEIEESLRKQGWILSQNRKGGFRVALSTSSRGTKMIEVIDVFGNPGVHKDDVWTANIKHITNIPQSIRGEILAAFTWGADGWAKELYGDVPETSDEDLKNIGLDIDNQRE